MSPEKAEAEVQRWAKHTVFIGAWLLITMLLFGYDVFGLLITTLFFYCMVRFFLAEWDKKRVDKGKQVR